MSCHGASPTAKQSYRAHGSQHTTRVDAAGHKACLLSSRLVCLHVSVLYSSASVLRNSSGHTLTKRYGGSAFQFEVRAMDQLHDLGVPFRIIPNDLGAIESFE